MVGQVVNQSELEDEQRYFDDAAIAREGRRRSTFEFSRAQAGPDVNIAEAAIYWRQVSESILSADEAVAFGRIELEASADPVIYIGKQPIWNQNADLLVSSWQAPTARKFYVATPNSPQGVLTRRNFVTERNRITDIEDEVLREVLQKIQDFEIGRVLDAEEVAQASGVTDVLLRELERDRDAKMRDIVQTIQAAQYDVIEHPSDATLVLQGGPGTGKTSVALSRLSFILFNNTEKIAPKEVLVIGPNPRFMDYIADVLPALGNTNIKQMSVDVLCVRSETGGTFQESPVSVLTLKHDARMVGLLNRAIWDRLRYPSENFSFKGTTITQSQLHAWFESAKKLGSYSVGRLAFRNSISDYLIDEDPDNKLPPSSLDALVNRVWPSMSPQAVLRDLFGSHERLLRAGGTDFSAAEVTSLYRRSAQSVSNQIWDSADPLLLDELAGILGSDFAKFKHIVVDEAQDLSFMQLRAIARRSVNFSMTLVGDMSQSSRLWGFRTWESLVLALKESADYVYKELTVSYRLPAEILDFAAPIMQAISPDVSVPTSVRQVPNALSIRYLGGDADADEMNLDEVLEEVDTTLDELRTRFGADIGTVALVWDEPEDCSEYMLTYYNDVPELSILKPHEVKGLEFNHVFVIDPHAIVRDGLFGWTSLFIACTRSTQSLNVIVAGDAMPEIPTVQPTEAEVLQQLPSEMSSEKLPDLSHLAPIAAKFAAQQIADYIRSTWQRERWRDIAVATVEILELDE
jgi:DNA helicase IV